MNICETMGIGHKAKVPWKKKSLRCVVESLRLSCMWQLRVITSLCCVFKTRKKHDIILIPSVVWKFMHQDYK
jgi:hypothetical protein